VSYEQAAERSFSAAKKWGKMAPRWLDKYGVPLQVYDSVKEVDDGCGATISVEQANPLLAPYNMILLQHGKRVVISVLDIERPWPTNWCSVADSIVCGGEQQPLAKLGRKRWQTRQSKKEEVTT
jgi:hypothetical protein